MNNSTPNKPFDNFIDAYFATISESEIGRVFPNERNEEILAVKNEKVRTQKYFVWKLLERALKKSLGLDIGNLSFSKTPDGKWVCDKCEFSLTHSDEIVAVAVSNLPVGIDAEKVRSVSPTTIKKVLSGDEYAYYESLSETERQEFFIKKWTQKESAFKKGNSPVFAFKNDTDEKDIFFTQKIEQNGNSYYLTIAHENNACVRIERIDF